MIENTWYELENKYPSVSLDYFVVMPNHIHGIISIVGAGLCVRPELNKSEKGSTQRSTPTLGDMIRWFKTITTNYYIQGIDQHGWQRFDKRLWQRNYYERIIRNEIELNTIRQYIQDNPQNWELDTNNILHD